MATTTTIHQLTQYQLYALKVLYDSGDWIDSMGIDQSGAIIIEHSRHPNEAPSSIRIERGESIVEIKDMKAFPWTMDWITAPGLEELGKKNTGNDNRGATT